MIKTATLSSDGRFRFSLERIWFPQCSNLLVCMLNPSTADAEKDDPTITRLITRAMNYGYGGIVVMNLYCFRTPYPDALWHEWAHGGDVKGIADSSYSLAASKAQDVLVAWGRLPKGKTRDQQVLAALYAGRTGQILTLGLTKDGFPRHPLHVAYAVPMIPYKGRFAQ